MGLPVSKRTYSPPNSFCPTQRRWESALCWPWGGISPIAHQGEPPITGLLQHTSITTESVKEGKGASIALTLTCGRLTDSTMEYRAKNQRSPRSATISAAIDPGIFANRRRTSSARSRFRVLLLALDSFDIFNGHAGSPSGGLGVNLERHAPIVS